MSNIIEIEQLTKSYGLRKAVDDISFSISEGALFGFVGPNGAGKTTTIRILTTLLRPTSGRVMVSGHSVTDDPRSVRKLLGYMPDFFGVYNDMTVDEYLDFFAACYDISLAKRPALIADLLDLVELSHRRNDFVDSLSRGMKQRLSLARALVHDPKVLVLDEPASGLDPRARVEFRDLLVELKRMGKTIFFSSHILADIAEICNEVGIIETGNMVTVGHIESLKRQLQQTHALRIRVLGDMVQPAKAVLATVDGLHDLQIEAAPDGDWDLVSEFSGDKAALSHLLKQLVMANVPVLSFQAESDDLEDVFMKLTKGIVS